MCRKHTLNIFIIFYTIQVIHVHTIGACISQRYVWTTILYFPHLHMTPAQLSKVNVDGWNQCSEIPLWIEANTDFFTLSIKYKTPNIHSYQNNGFCDLNYISTSPDIYRKLIHEYSIIHWPRQYKHKAIARSMKVIGNNILFKNNINSLALLNLFLKNKTKITPHSLGHPLAEFKHGKISCCYSSNQWASLCSHDSSFINSSFEWESPRTKVGHSENFFPERDILGF